MNDKEIALELTKILVNNVNLISINSKEICDTYAQFYKTVSEC